MGVLVDGKWQADEDSGEPGPSGQGGFPAEPGRYHLYVSMACPWAHRTLIFRKLKGLEDIVSVSVTEPEMLENGWEYAQTESGTADTVNGFRYHHELYTAADPRYTGRATVPVLWDKRRGTIVSNESSEIIRMLNDAFAPFTEDDTDYYPPALRAAIDAVNERVYENVNNGVYRCGFATSQAAYERAFDRLFETLDELESRLAQSRYLVGEYLTEADWRLFTTLVRFDAVYHGHFKTNLRRIRDYPQLANHLRDLYQVPGVAGTVDVAQIKRHYYYSHAWVNPTRIVPKGPELDFDRPHDRERFGARRTMRRAA